MYSLETHEDSSKSLKPEKPEVILSVIALSFRRESSLSRASFAPSSASPSPSPLHRISILFRTLSIRSWVRFLRLRQHGGNDGRYAAERRVQFRLVPEKRHVGEEWRRPASFPEDGNDNCRSRVQGEIGRS